MTALIKLALTGVLVAGTALAAMPAFAADYTIVIDKMKFGPVPAELHAGDTIIWQNNDIFRHSATARRVRKLAANEVRHNWAGLDRKQDCSFACPRGSMQFRFGSPAVHRLTSDLMWAIDRILTTERSGAQRASFAGAPQRGGRIVFLHSRGNSSLG